MTTHEHALCAGRIREGDNLALCQLRIPLCCLGNDLRPLWGLSFMMDKNLAPQSLKSVDQKTQQQHRTMLHNKHLKQKEARTFVTNLLFSANSEAVGEVLCYASLRCSTELPVQGMEDFKPPLCPLNYCLLWGMQQPQCNSDSVGNLSNL